jgi:hypothetical protein
MDPARSGGEKEGQGYGAGKGIGEVWFVLPDRLMT